jgi:hypothetical protein
MSEVKYMIVIRYVDHPAEYDVQCGLRLFPERWKILTCELMLRGSDVLQRAGFGAL